MEEMIAIENDVSVEEMIAMKNDITVEEVSAIQFKSTNSKMTPIFRSNPI